MGQQELIKVIVAGTVITLVLGSCIIFFVLFYKRRQQKFKLEKMQMEQNFKEELLRTQLEIQEQTLSNISQEIHDNIGQTLSLAKLNLNTLDMDEGREQKLANTRELVSKAIGDLRSLSKTLNADTIVSAGLLKAVGYELVQVGKAGAFTTELDVTGAVSKLSAQKELILFRIVQESLNNIIKHSAATVIKVQANYSAEELQLVISDNGNGFVAENNAGSMENGSGLRNMKSRASLIGGSISIETQPNQGTKITVTIPINES